jgi:DNA-binding MarR family transcriptional regulator
MQHTAQPLDRESLAAADDHFALKLWLRLLTCTSLVEGRIRQELRHHFAWTLPRFDLLAQLERSRDGLRMGELSKRLMVTGGNVTGLADQLEAEGMIQREPVANDRRATVVRLTPQGRRAFAEMARTHERWVIGMFGALSRDEQRQLHQLLGRLKTGLAAAAPPAAPQDSPEPIAPRRRRSR